MSDDEIVRDVHCTLSVVNGTIVFRIGDRGEQLVLDADTADQLATDLRSAAIEARNGGAPG